MVSMGWPPWDGCPSVARWRATGATFVGKVPAHTHVTNSTYQISHIRTFEPAMVCWMVWDRRNSGYSLEGLCQATQSMNEGSGVSNNTFDKSLVFFGQNSASLVSWWFEPNVPCCWYLQCNYKSVNAVYSKQKIFKYAQFRIFAPLYWVLSMSE